MSQDLSRLSTSVPVLSDAFHQQWDDHSAALEDEAVSWVDMLRAQEVRAAHLDDGWVRRVPPLTFQLVYPWFNDGLNEGSLVALGHPRQYRIVVVTRLRPNPRGFAEAQEYEYAQSTVLPTAVVPTRLVLPRWLRLIRLVLRQLWRARS